MIFVKGSCRICFGKDVTVDEAAQCILDSTYFAITFLIHPMNGLYLEESNTHVATSHLHRPLLPVLYDWFSIITDHLISQTS